MKTIFPKPNGLERLGLKFLKREDKVFTGSKLAGKDWQSGRSEQLHILRPLNKEA